MATSSNDSCTAPEKFYLSSSNSEIDCDGNNSLSRLTFNHIKCPLCFKSRKVFHCRDCIRNGNFVHSIDYNNPNTERFYDKQKQYINVKASHIYFEEKINSFLQKEKIVENLKSAILQKQKKIIILKKLLSETENNITKCSERKKSLTNFNRNLRFKLPKYEDKVKELEQYVATKCDDIKKRNEIYSKFEIDLKFIIRSSVQKLIKYIFPIKKVVEKNQISQASEITDLERDLAEATKNINSRERSSFTHDNQNDVFYVIVAPFLQGNGDYSEYNEWVASNKDGVPSSTTTNTSSGTGFASNVGILSKPNPAVRISAALTYTAQLVHVLSYLLDIRLPFKSVYSDFCSCMLSEQLLTRRVARLNTNILYLCYTQHVKISELHPSHTIENVLTLLEVEKKDLGRIGPFDPTDCNLSKNLEQQLIEELEFGDETDSDDENNFPNEWENVSHNVLLSPSHIDNPVNLTHQQYFINQQTSASMAGGLMTSAAASIASIWRGWTTGK